MGLFDKFNGDMIQEKLSQGLTDAVEKVSNERETYYKNHSNPSKDTVIQL